MRLTSSLFESYLKCRMKCFLRSRQAAGKGNVYADWLLSQKELYRYNGEKELQKTFEQSKIIVRSTATEGLKKANWLLAMDLIAQGNNIESCLHAVEHRPSGVRGRPAQFIPIRFISTNKLSKDDNLLLAFDALVLSEVIGREVGFGKIVHGDDYVTKKVKTSTLANTVRTLTDKIITLLPTDSSPDLVLKRHCGQCEFQALCRQEAIKKDELTPPGGMTEKERKKYNSKGIFTITQLSYNFRPRRRPKRHVEKREKYHHSLKALSIREGRTHIVGKPELKLGGTPVYLDVEALPDIGFYYLIGVRVTTGDSVTQHSLWAADTHQEQKIWSDFIDLSAVRAF